MKNKNNLINLNNIDQATAIKNAGAYHNITSRVNFKTDHDLDRHIDNLVNFYGLAALTLLVNRRNNKKGAA